MVRFGDLNFEEIAQYTQVDCLAVVPTGCTEQQGPHLPVDFDTWFVERVCVAAAEKAQQAFSLDVLVFPAMPFGPTPEHRGFGFGFIDLPQRLHEQVVMAVLNSIADQGFRRIVIWRGCGQHVLEQVVESFNHIHQGCAYTFLPDIPYHDIWMKVGNPMTPGGHADSFATAIAMHLRPESVRDEKIIDPQSDPVDWDDPDLDFSQYSRTGVIGDPTQATAELGDALWQAVVLRVAEIYKTLAETPSTDIGL